MWLKKGCVQKVRRTAPKGLQNIRQILMMKLSRKRARGFKLRQVGRVFKKNKYMFAPKGGFVLKFEHAKFIK